MPMNIHLEHLEVIIVATLVLFLGRFVSQKIHSLEHYNVPNAVTGGIICSLAVALLQTLWDIKISFDLQLRDLLLLFFFSTIGLNAKLSTLGQGGI